MRKWFTALLAAMALVSTPVVAAEKEAYQKVQPLLATDKTILGEKLLLSDGSPLEITSTIVTIEPGEKTAWHKHGVPLYAYVLAGELTVDYGDKGTRTFGPGIAFMEAMDHWHHGINTSGKPVRILTVYLGSDKARNVIVKE
ncbi:MAG: cupin domain-containing protein [Alphaproteobacteria bacterium]